MMDDPTITNTISASQLMHNREQYTTDNDSIGDKRHRDDILSGSISANIETDG